jgi:uncharacterized protein
MTKPPHLNAHEARLLGVLFEKERTTPDQYPLSLHALTAGANQKSNRDPMTDWSEAEVLVGVTGLMQKGLAGKVFPTGSRVEKFRHNARETLALDDRKLALLSELMMRGPQTVGELRTRALRMTELGSVEAVLADLGVLAEQGFVRRLAPGAGSRAERWTQLLSPDLHPITTSREAPTAGEPQSPRVTSDLEERVAKLEARVAELERAITS